MHYTDQGTGNPIVLLPGGSLNSSYLAPLAEELVAAGHRVVRIDARRPPQDPDEVVTMHDLAADVAGVMAELDLPPGWVAGHAFGNRVARAVALDHPDRVSGVILLAAGGTVQPEPAAQEALKVAFSNVPDDEAIESMKYMVGDPAEAKSAWEAIKVARDPSLGAMQRQAVIATPQDEWARLAPGKTALIIQGSRDQIAPPANGEQLAAENPGQVKLAWIDGAGHLFPFLQPDRTARAIVENI